MNFAEVKYVKVINENNEFGKTYEVSATAGEGKFAISEPIASVTAVPSAAVFKLGLSI